MCEKIKINVEKVKTITSIFVTKNHEYSFILNRFYEKRICVCTINIKNKACKIKIINDNKIKINFNAVFFKHAFNREVLNFFLKYLTFL